MDKKIYQKLQRYEDDKRFLFDLFIKDQLNYAKKDYEPKLDFQSVEAQDLFEKSIPECIKQECRDRMKPEQMMMDENGSEDSNGGSTTFDEKLQQILAAIKFEQELYELLKDLKKERNKNKRLPQKLK